VRKFFTSGIVVGLVLIILVCLGSALYTGATGNVTPITEGLGIVMQPFQKAATTAGEFVRNGWSFLTDYQAAQEENEELRAQIAEMEQTVRDAQVALDENARLRTLLGIKERNRSFTFEVAEVIARSPGDWAVTITLDKGTLNDISEGDLVITEEGMVGYVSVAALNYSEVVTVIDTEMQAGAIITRSREVGIAQGDYTLMEEGMLKLSYLGRDADVVIGDTIETSGRGGVFPKGILIGTVEGVEPEENGIANYAVIRPFVDVSTVSHVFIIKDFEITE
jgi:rod shape-determining protein MreC